MERRLLIKNRYLYLPICAGKKEERMEIFRCAADAEREKIFEFMIPVDESQTESYVCDYLAEVPISDFLEEEIMISMEAPSAFMERIENREKVKKEAEDRPVLHFTADAGWINDPNGLIFDDGLYHLYFQYNTFDIRWNNMSWGHAVSRDLLHWQQLDTVMFPDRDGVIYSGCALKNDRGMLNLPETALLFFYTAAGGYNEWSSGRKFTQKTAYSLDRGMTLTRFKEPCLPALFAENRDPKIFWHEETKAYVMVLWMMENDYGIFRSRDLAYWEQTDQFTLEGAWECPNLFALTADDGKRCWFFWTADGFYYEGQFDGYHFRTDARRQYAYANQFPYAAQSYSGITDRLVMIPWLRMENDGRRFTGACGIPVEMTCRKTEQGYELIQRPVGEVFQQGKKIREGKTETENPFVFHGEAGKKKAYMLKVRAEKSSFESCSWIINGSRILYTEASGVFSVEGVEYQVGCGHREFLLLVDDRILEVFFGSSGKTGIFFLKEREAELEMSSEAPLEYTLYEIE